MLRIHTHAPPQKKPNPNPPTTGSVEDLVLDSSPSTSPTHAIRGITTAAGQTLLAPTVVITTGTFLKGKCYLGKTSYAAGRHLRNSQEVEAPSIGLSNTLEQKLALPLGRLKTGTPPRLDGKTIDWARLEPQPSDDPPRPFSYLNSAVTLAGRLIKVGFGGGGVWGVLGALVMGVWIDRCVACPVLVGWFFHRTTPPLDIPDATAHTPTHAQTKSQPFPTPTPKKTQCYKTFTNERTHKLVMDNAHLLPDYDGDGGKGVGPRYCPSLFKKVGSVVVFVVGYVCVYGCGWAGA